MSNLHALKRKDALPAVGRDIDAWCTRCKMELGHTITAMVDRTVAQVRCNTCRSVHRFKASVAAGKIRRAAGKRTTASAERAKTREKAAAARADALHYQRLMADRDPADAVPYSPRLDPVVGDLLQHAKFGTGVVRSVHGGKARVLFAGGGKLLIVGR